jgi:flavin-dependent dehydrogenase
MHIAIVGGSLAGAFLAVELGGTEHQITILDPRAPWEKPCGGGLFADTLQKYPVLRTACAWHYPLRFRWISSTGDRSVPAKAQWAIASREDLNRGLLRVALQNQNVQLVPDRVTAIVPQGSGWQVHAESGRCLEAELVIGADGVNSVVRRDLVGRLPREHTGITVGYLVAPGPTDEVIIQTYPDQIGYAWYFPRTDHACVGFGTRATTADVPGMWQRLEAFMGKHCPGANKQSRWGAAIPAVSNGAFWAQPCAGPGWALIGDAAGHVQTLLGEGISCALTDAHLVAQAIRGGNLQAYDKAWRKEHGAWLRHSSEALGAILRSGSCVDYERAVGLALGGSPWLANLYAQAAGRVRRLGRS